MTSAEYLGRRLSPRARRNKQTGERRVEVRCNGQFFCYEVNMTEAAALDLAMRYVDEAEVRPAAYPVLRRAA